MAKINFTQDHFAQMQHLLLGMLMSNTTITTKLGGELNVVELLHTTTINTLNSIRLSLAKHIENLESKDEWIADNASQEALDKAKAQKELVNLIIGYKRYMLEREETKRKKAALGKQEKDTDTVIQGWVARDFDGDVFLYQNEPDRNEIAWNGYMMHSLPVDSFPDLTWESDPLPVEIIIKRKKK